MQVLFLGAPGSGKGTQCKKLSAKLGLAHLSSGDLLRAAIRENTATGLKAKEFMDKGLLVPDPVLIDMFREALSMPALKKGFILDGFPRNLAQAESLDKLLDELDMKLNAVIDMEIDTSLLEERLVGRRSCPNKVCNNVFHVKFAPPKEADVCDYCQSQLVHRSDDKVEVVSSRLETYKRETEPLIGFYKGKGVLQSLNADDTPEHIFEQILKVLQVSV
ncbi:adenylate kinase [bacterium]|nr:adenylate kinase [bacterium]QQR57614.1 MAG: adenylate kinase [Candidatus Melainabacteria bacterium]